MEARHDGKTVRHSRGAHLRQTQRPKRSIDGLQGHAYEQVVDYLIDRLQHDPMVDQLRIRRLKKRKLLIKDMITNLESELIPDLDA